MLVTSGLLLHLLAAVAPADSITIQVVRTNNGAPVSGAYVVVSTSLDEDATDLFNGHTNSNGEITTKKLSANRWPTVCIRVHPPKAEKLLRTAFKDVELKQKIKLELGPVFLPRVGRCQQPIAQAVPLVYREVWYWDPALGAYVRRLVPLTSVRQPCYSCHVTPFSSSYQTGSVITYAPAKCYYYPLHQQRTAPVSCCPPAVYCYPPSACYYCPPATCN